MNNIIEWIIDVIFASISACVRAYDKVYVVLRSAFIRVYDAIHAFFHKGVK